MRGGSWSTIMIFFMANTSRRGLSLVTSLPGRLRIAPPTAGRSSCLVNSNTNLLRATYAASAALEGRGSTRLLVAPLSLAAARSGPGGNPNSSRSSSSSSSSSSSKRKLRHAPASTQGGATNSPGGARWRLSSDAAAVGGSPRAAGARKMAWGAGAGAGGRGWDQASSYGSPGGGRGGRGGPSRGLHDSRPYTPRPQSFGEIPEDQLQISFTRASGAGGQNVNKVSTKVEMRFVVLEAEWLPHDVRLRLARQEKGRINNKGELVITAQDFRYVNRPYSRDHHARTRHTHTYTHTHTPGPLNVYGETCLALLVVVSSGGPKKQDAEAEPISGSAEATGNDQRGVGTGEGEENAHRDRQEREGDAQARQASQVQGQGRAQQAELKRF